MPHHGTMRTATTTRTRPLSPAAVAVRLRILVAVEGSVLAHVGRSLCVARALESAGHEVSFAASGRYASRFAETGRPLHPLVTRPDDELLGRLKSGGSAFDYATLRAYVEDEIPLLDRLDPDIVVGDFRPSLAVSAEIARIPYVCVTNAVWTPYYRFLPDPPDSWWPTKIIGKPVLRRLVPLLSEYVFRHYAGPFNRLRKEFGLPPKDDVRDCMCSENLTLIADLPELFPCDGLPENYKYMGPVVWTPEEPMPAWIERLDDSRPTLYVTMGSTGTAVGPIAAALAERGFQVIVTTGSEIIPDPPKGCYAVHYAPGPLMCERADVVVCHGGNGTIYQALSQGKPIVGVPLFHDQEFQMQRVVACGLGLSVPPGPNLPDRISRAVEEVLGDETYAERAETFRQLIQDWDYARSLPDLVARYARSSGSACVGKTQ